MSRINLSVNGFTVTAANHDSDKGTVKVTVKNKHNLFVDLITNDGAGNKLNTHLVDSPAMLAAVINSCASERYSDVRELEVK